MKYCGIVTDRNHCEEAKYFICKVEDGLIGLGSKLRGTWNHKLWISINSAKKSQDRRIYSDEVPMAEPTDITQRRQNGKIV